MKIFFRTVFLYYRVNNNQKFSFSSNQHMVLQIDFRGNTTNFDFIIYNKLIRVGIRMQGNNQSKLNSNFLLRQLISKISRLRKKLVSCGYSLKEVIDIIFLQFLRLPEIDWSHLQETNNFYEVKTNYKVDSASAEIIMRLQKIVPNLHTIQVCQYLITILQINATDFGFNLIQSSSDSNDSGSGMNKLIIGKQKRRLKRTQKREQHSQKTRKYKCQQIMTKKKAHLDEQYLKDKRVEEEVDLFFRNKPLNTLLPFQQYQIGKQMKKVPESSDSEHQ